MTCWFHGCWVAKLFKFRCLCFVQERWDMRDEKIISHIYTLQTHCCNFKIGILRVRGWSSSEHTFKEKFLKKKKFKFFKPTKKPPSNRLMMIIILEASNKNSVWTPKLKAQSERMKNFQQQTFFFSFKIQITKQQTGRSSFIVRRLSVVRRAYLYIMMPLLVSEVWTP